MSVSSSVSLGFAAILTVVSLACSSTTSGSGTSGGARSCADLCTDAQAGKCTAIKGDCSAFCKSLATVAPPASCEPKRTAYIACLNKKAVCDQSCSSEDTDLQSCIATYCAPRKTESDCAVLIASF